MSEEIVTTADTAASDEARLASAKGLTTAIYALQAAAFVFGITFIVAVILNYVKRSDVAGTWLESHFRWQIRTFWFGLLWTVVGTVTALVVVGYLVLIANLVWVLYRIIKGWMRLNDGREMYVAA